MTLTQATPMKRSQPHTPYAFQSAKKTLRRFLALCLLLALPARAYASESILLLQSKPAAGETVYPGDTISYTVSIGRDGQALDWAWLRITLGDGLTLDEGSILLDCAPAIPVDDLPPGEDGAEPSPRPITRDLILGNTGFVLLSSALLTGDTVSFDVLVEEGADVLLTAQVHETTSASLAHTLGVRPVETDDAPAYIYTPPEPPAEPEARGSLLWLWIALGVLAACAVVYVLHLRGVLALPFLPAKQPARKRRRKPAPRHKPAGGATQPGAAPAQPESPEQESSLPQPPQTVPTGHATPSPSPRSQATPIPPQRSAPRPTPPQGSQPPKVPQSSQGPQLPQWQPPPPPTWAGVQQKAKDAPEEPGKETPT